MNIDSKVVSFIIEVILFLITVGGIVWRIAIMSSNIKSNKETIDELKKSNVSLETSVNLIPKMQTQVDNHETEIKNLKNISTVIQQVKTNTEDIKELKENQTTLESTLTNINNTLVSISVKIDMIFDGRIKILTKESV